MYHPMNPTLQFSYHVLMPQKFCSAFVPQLQQIRKKVTNSLDSVINIRLTSYRLLHQSHRRALSLGLSSLLHFEVQDQAYHAPAGLPP